MTNNRAFLIHPTHPVAPPVPVYDNLHSCIIANNMVNLIMKLLIFCVLRVLFIEKFIFDERSSKFKVKTRGHRMQQSGASQRGAVGSLQKQQHLRQQSNVYLGSPAPFV